MRDSGALLRNRRFAASSIRHCVRYCIGELPTRFWKRSASTERDEIVQQCFRRGLLLLGSGVNTIRFCPPLVVTKEQCDTAVSILDDVLKKWD